MNNFQKLRKGYELSKIWNMDQLGLFLKPFRKKGFLKNHFPQKKVRNMICTAAIFSAANSSKVTDPVLIRRSHKPNRFRNLKDIRRALNVHYCSNEKSWMNTRIMEFRLKIVWRG